MLSKTVCKQCKEYIMRFVRLSSFAHHYNYRLTDFGIVIVRPEGDKLLQCCGDSCPYALEHMMKEDMTNAK